MLQALAEGGALAEKLLEIEHFKNNPSPLIGVQIVFLKANPEKPEEPHVLVTGSGVDMLGSELFQGFAPIYQELLEEYENGLKMLADNAIEQLQLAP